MAHKGSAAARDSVDGIATFETVMDRGRVQFTVYPGTDTGTGTVTVKPGGATDQAAGYEAVYETDGVTALTVDLSVQTTVTLEGIYEGIKVETDQSPPGTFKLIVAEY